MNKKNSRETYKSVKVMFVHSSEDLSGHPTWRTNAYIRRMYSDVSNAATVQVRPKRNSSIEITKLHYRFFSVCFLTVQVDQNVFAFDVTVDYILRMQLY